ncbi:MAG: lamin tail domain-containing protein [Candidatus Kapaibacterium sp.]
MRLLTLLVSAVLLLVSQTYAQIRINEVCSSNSESLYDEDSDTPDWIELYNYSDQPVNLSTWKISDQPDSELAWQFPDTIINPNEYLLVYASGKNLIGITKLSMKTKSFGSIVPFNNRDAYRYRYKQLTGDFHAELKVRSILNEGVWSLCGIQIRADLSDTTNFFGMFVGSKAKDGFFNYWRDTILYIPKFKALYGSLNLPYTKLSLTRKNDSLYCSYIDRNGNEGYKESYHNFLPDNILIGVSVSANNENQFAEFILDSFLINNEYTDLINLDLFEVNEKEAGIDSYYNEIHTNFSIKDDETLYLYNNNIIVDSVKLQPMSGDVSNMLNDENEWRITDKPTPAEKNGFGYLTRLSKPMISFKNGNIDITDTNDATIRYTLDNSLPNLESKIYNLSQPITLSKTTVIKAIVYKDNYLPSFVQSELIRINEPEFKLPIISISVDSADLWGQYGILNTIYNSQKVASLNYYDMNSNLSSNILIKVHGQSSRFLPQKSLRIYSDKKSDYTRIKNVFFDNVHKEYDQLVLRNSGQDWNSLYIRDSFNSVIASKLQNQIYAQYKPIIFYLNNEFYGLINLRERIEDEFLSDIYNLNDKSINFFENNGITVRGDYFEYLNFVNKFKDNNSTNINDIKNYLDVNNFFDYSLLYIYSINSDWPSLNVKLFNSKQGDRKFRYIVNDLDVTYGYSADKQSFDKIESILNDTINDYSVVFNKVIKNSQLKVQFLSRAADLINSVFRTENMKSVLDSLTEQIREYIPLQQQRWEGSCIDWEEKIDVMKVFLEERPAFFMNNLNFHLNESKGTSNFSLSTYPPNSGTFKVNTITVDTSEWSGRYFQTLPVTITAIPKHGMKFVKWNQDSLGTEPTITTTLSESIEIEAIFEKINLNEQGRAIVINEIMYNADKGQDTKDWIELYNAGTKAVSLKGWSIIDEDTSHTKFVINEDYLIQPNELVILTKELEEFEEAIFISNKKFGDFDFGLGGNDIIRLIDENGVTHDSVNYDNDAPWPVDADGSGYTIELIHPNLDNNIGANWRISKMKLGTAGGVNSSYDSLQTSVHFYLSSKGLNLEQHDRKIDIITVELIKSIGLYTITGKEIKIEAIRNTNQLTLDLNNIERGIYLLMVNTDSKTETIKILLK